MDELNPLLKIIFPKTDESVYRTITLVAVINASFAALPGKMGIGVFISVALEIAMAVAIANHVGLHEIRKENIYKYLGTIATVGFSILVLFKEAISAAFSLFSSFTGPLNPLIPAEYTQAVEFIKRKIPVLTESEIGFLIDEITGLHNPPV